jgi:hypothetical protein
MSKVIIFSRYFPSYHVKRGEPTYFVEKILQGLSLDKWDLEREFNPRLSLDFFEPKYHTIRAGHRWKVGDKFSPRVWSGKPYQSKQIIIAPDIEVKKVWDFEITTAYNSEMRGDISNFIYINRKLVLLNEYEKLAKNDGLTVGDMCEWFKIAFEEDYREAYFKGQIICWNPQIEY